MVQTSNPFHRIPLSGGVSWLVKTTLDYCNYTKNKSKYQLFCCIGSIIFLKCGFQCLILQIISELFKRRQSIFLTLLSTSSPKM